MFAYLAVRHREGIVGLLEAVTVAALSYLVMIRVLHGLEPSDRERLSPIGTRLPGTLRVLYQGVLSFATPPARPKAKALV
jgi:hypothetical protein